MTTPVCCHAVLGEEVTGMRYRIVLLMVVLSSALVLASVVGGEFWGG